MAVVSSISGVKKQGGKVTLSLSLSIYYARESFLFLRSSFNEISTRVQLVYCGCRGDYTVKGSSEPITTIRPLPVLDFYFDKFPWSSPLFRGASDNHRQTSEPITIGGFIKFGGCGCLRNQYPLSLSLLLFIRSYLLFL